MKLVIQIPCKDEARQLPATLAALPRRLDSIDQLLWLVVDDGSTDDTAAVALSHGVDHIVRIPKNRGLANAFSAGLEASCRLGADVVVNLDADNQYDAGAISAMIGPIIDGDADIVVGCRPIATIAHFSPLKKWLQVFGSRVVRVISGVQVSDATSGFRAYSREAAMRLNVYSRYTYTLETLIQAGHSGLQVVEVPVGINPPTRESRLIKSVPRYVWRSMLTILRSFLTYRPLGFFLLPAVFCFVVSGAIGGLFVAQYLRDDGSGHVQSLILSTILSIIGAVCVAIGLLANQLAVNRRLLEQLQLAQRRKDWRAA